MHPAVSIIVFTVFSGLGFGLMAFLGLGFHQPTGRVAFVFFALAYGLAGAGLIASTFHLGHPERALKAFTQWRSSWLSREAWAAVVAMGVMGLFALPLIFSGTYIAPLGWLGALASVVTIAATSMIYTQLKTVPRWHHWTTPALFLAHGLAGGALLAGEVTGASVFLAILLLLQLYAWHVGDAAYAGSGSTLGTATGLGPRGAVRAFEPPHTGPNYLTKEMVHVIGRKHSRTLRATGLGLSVVLPLVILQALPFSHALAGLAVLSHIAGSLCTRWLFFAEAEHVVGLYYGRTA